MIIINRVQRTSYLEEGRRVVELLQRPVNELFELFVQ